MSQIPDKFRRAAGFRSGVVLALMAGMVAGGAAAQDGRSPVANDCPARWRRHASSDSSVTICLPAGFVRREAHTWMRPSRVRGAPPADFFSVEVIAWPADSASVGRWPPSLAPEPGCQFDCITVDSTMQHRDAWDGVTAHTEIGLASGGVAGLRRRPVMVSSWIVSSDRRGFAQGWAAKAVTLDTLRQALRTVKVLP
jgi:hypothetical protein